MKNTITAFLIGTAIGALVVYMLSDTQSQEELFVQSVSLENYELLNSARIVRQDTVECWLGQYQDWNKKSQNNHHLMPNIDPTTKGKCSSIDTYNVNEGVNSFFLTLEELQQVLSAPDCSGLRIYLAQRPQKLFSKHRNDFYTHVGTTVVLSPTEYDSVDKEHDNIIGSNNEILALEYVQPCPNYCSYDNKFNVTAGACKKIEKCN